MIEGFISGYLSGKKVKKRIKQKKEQDYYCQVQIPVALFQYQLHFGPKI